MTRPRFRQRRALSLQRRPQRWREGSSAPLFPEAYPLSCSSTLQLDADDAKPNFDEEEGQDEYNEAPMPV